MCWPTASASDIINFFSAPSHSTWIHYGAPRLHLAFSLQFENKMSKKFLHKTWATWAVNQFAVLVKIASPGFVFCTARATSTSSGCLLICILKVHYKFVQQVLEPTFSFGLANFFSSIYLMLFLAASSQN